VFVRRRRNSDVTTEKPKLTEIKGWQDLAAARCTHGSQSAGASKSPDRRTKFELVCLEREVIGTREEDVLSRVSGRGSEVGDRDVSPRSPRSPRSPAKSASETEHSGTGSLRIGVSTRVRNQH
jgi:hypothetical protein